MFANIALYLEHGFDRPIVTMEH